ncbi:MAG: tetratricopeptide repeat protein [Deltaproteobacteria bacterium]|nr:tetratricopeptide repeat protein [Deltaproteobacteria bacterium]
MMLVALTMALLAVPADATVSSLAAARRDNRRGIELFRRGRMEEAAALFERARAVAPADVEIINNQAAALARLGRRDDAESAFVAALALDPQRWQALTGLADLYADDPRRFERREPWRAALLAGLGRLAAAGAVNHAALAVAKFELAVGRVDDARGRLTQIDETQLTRGQRMRRGQLLLAAEAAESARSLGEWPEPAVTPELQLQLADQEAALARGQTAPALRWADALVDDWPAWRGLRLLRARALENLGRYDDAARELTVVLRLQPLHAAGWRRLGTLLATRGGLLEAPRAAEALRRALALDPQQSELWLLLARVSIRQGALAEAERALERFLLDLPARRGDVEVQEIRAAIARPPSDLRAASQPAAPPPSAEARALLREAQDWIADGDPLALAAELLERALIDSPAFVEAAALYYSSQGVVLPQTVSALWQAPADLLQLARLVRQAATPESRLVVRPWLDRAIDLGAVDGFLDRALLNADEGHPAPALADLEQYVARATEPARLREALALRAQLAGGERDLTGLLVESRLSRGDADGALQLLDPDCSPGASHLLLAGRAQEYRGDYPAAARCYQRAVAGGDRLPALGRLAALLARRDAPSVEPSLALLREASASGVAVADWALARYHLEQRQPARAEPLIDRYLAHAGADDPWVGEARAARDAARAAQRSSAEARRRAAMAIAIGLALLLGGGLAWRLRAATVQRALVARPALFPDLASCIHAIRHDVLKHRASALGMLGSSGVAVADVVATLREPTPTSAAVAALYQTLRGQARASGVALRPIEREPVFGPLQRDLRCAERLAADPRRTATVLAIDRRLRERHAARLQALLQSGPRTRLDAAIVSAWLRALAAEQRQRGAGWVVPAVAIAEDEIVCPVETQALWSIFGNLVSNAEQAVARADERQILIRLQQERDAADRRVVALWVADSSPQELTLALVEAQPAERGLGIVREQVRRWRGQLLVRAEAAPWHKAIGVMFAA